MTWAGKRIQNFGWKFWSEDNSRESYA